MRVVSALLLVGVMLAGCNQGPSGAQSDDGATTSATVTSTSKTSTTSSATSSSATSSTSAPVPGSFYSYTPPTTSSDKTAPSITLEAPPAIYGTRAEISVDVGDESATTVRVEFGRSGVGGSSSTCPKENGTTGLVIVCQQSGNQTGPGGLIFALTSLEADMDYKFWVVAKDVVGNRGVLYGGIFHTGAGSSSGGTTTSAADTTPPTITSPLITNVLQTSAHVAYGVSDPGGTGVSSSRVQWSTSSTFPSGSVQQSSPFSGSGTKNFDITGLLGATQYFVRVTAQDNLANGGTSSVVSFTTASAPVVGVTNVVVSDLGHNTFTVSWTVSGTSAAQTSVEYGTSAALGSTTAVQTGAGTKSVLIGSLTPATTYHFRVHATDPPATAVNTAIQQQETAQFLQVTINGVSAPSFTNNPVSLTANKPFITKVTNNGGAPHDWELDGQTPAYKSSILSNGAVETFTVTKTLAAGSYAVHCNVHPGMTGTLNVV